MSKIQTHRLTRTGDSSPCDPADKGEAPKVKVGQQPCQRLSVEHLIISTILGPQAIYLEGLSQAISELKKPSVEKIKQRRGLSGGGHHLRAWMVDGAVEAISIFILVRFSVDYLLSTSGGAISTNRGYLHLLITLGKP